MSLAATSPLPTPTKGEARYLALVGCPNSGKTSLFNALTGAKQKVGNYPGVTVERKEGRLKISPSQKLKLLDLPGTYSLQAATLDEKITRQVLLGEALENNPPTALIVVVDATNLERQLNFVLELKSLGIPLILALNMMDLAKRRGLKLNLEVLAKDLAMPVVGVVATKPKTLSPLIAQVAKTWEQASSAVLPNPELNFKQEQGVATTKEAIKARYQEIDRLLQRAKETPLQPSRVTEALDRIFLHPLWGTLLLMAVLLTTFQAVFNGASLPMEWMEQGIDFVSQQVSALLPETWLRSLIVDGVIAGVGSVIIFLPQILLLFLILLLLEDSGYMARAAFLMDRHMGRVGLHGRAFIPLLSSFACAIPGIMAARTIENPRDRLVTILVAPLMACSARLPVYTLLIAAFIPNQKILGPIHLQGLVLLGLYLLGALSALAVAWFFKTWVWKKTSSLFLLELPTYKWPHLRSVFYGLWERAGLFLKRAGGIILAAAILMWFLSSYPKPSEPLPQGENPILYSYAGKIGQAIEPVIKPLGYDWSIGVGLITGVMAREVIVGSLGTLYAVEAADSEEGEQQLTQVLSKRWSVATGLSLLVFFVFAMQCLSTLAVVKRETNSWKYPLLQFSYLTLLAYGGAWLTYRVATAFGL